MSLFLRTKGMQIMVQVIDSDFPVRVTRNITEVEK